MSHSPALALRPATPDDVFFLAEAIAAAESAETAIQPLQRTFQLSNLQTRHLLLDLTETEVAGTPYSYANFWLLVDADNRPEAGLAAWIEAADGIGSNTLKAQQLSFLLGPERWSAARGRLQQLAAIDIPREPGSLQLDSIYVRPSRRGQGLVQQLLAHVPARLAAQNPDAQHAEILLLDTNQRALTAYAKAGFTEQRRVVSNDPTLPDLLPGSGRILLTRTLRPAAPL